MSFKDLVKSWLGFAGILLAGAIVWLAVREGKERIIGNLLFIFAVGPAMCVVSLLQLYLPERVKQGRWWLKKNIMTIGLLLFTALWFLFLASVVPAFEWLFSVCAAWKLLETIVLWKNGKVLPALTRQPPRTVTFRKPTNLTLRTKRRR